MKQLLQQKLKYHHLHFLSLLTLLCTQIAVAKPDDALNVRRLALTSITQAAKPTDVPEIKPGQLIQREIKAEDVHTYRVALKAGEYMKVGIQGFRFDLVMRAIDPGGNEIAKIELGGRGPAESLWTSAKTTGDYEIRLGSDEPKGTHRHYVLSLDKVGELKTAPASDQMYVQADQIYWEATKLGDRGGDQPLHQAIEKYQEVLVLWRTLGDPLAEAFTLHMLGFSYERLNEQQKAVEFYTQALSTWRTLKNHQENEANTFYNLGGLYSFLGRVPEAVKCFQEAIELRRALGNKNSLAFALNNLGQAYSNVGEFQAALKSFQEALQLRVEVGDIEGEARTLSNISGVYFGMGEFQEALNYCQQALPLRRATGNRTGEALTLANIGSNYRELGEPQRALEYYQQAIPLVRGQGGRLYEASMLDGVGQAYYDLGDYPKALEYQTQSLSLRQASNDRYGEGASLANVGRVYLRLGDLKKALEYFEQSLQLRRATGDRRGEAMTLQNAGALYRESGDQQKALAYFNEGLAISRAIKNRFYEATLLYNIALIEQSAGHVDEAISKVECAIAIVESTRARVAGSDVRASFFASKQDFYELDIDLLMQSDSGDRKQENLVKAFNVSEQRRARSLLDSLEQAQASIRRVVSPELLARASALRAKLDQKAESQIKLLSGKHTQEQADVLAKEVVTVSTDYEQVLAEIAASDPRYAALTQSAPLNLAAFQSETLDPDTLFLEYSLGNKRSYLWAVTPTDITAYELPGRAEIERQARSVYGLLTARNQFVKFEKADEKQARIAKADAEYFQAAGRLSQVLLGPIAAKLKGRRLLIVSDGALQYLPFAALPSPVVGGASANQQTANESYRPLVLDHEITNLPSASILGVLRREVAGRNSAPRTVAVLADPVFSKTDERVIATKPVRPRDQTDQAHPVLRGVDTQESELVRAVRDVGGENGLAIDRLPSTRLEAEAILGLVSKTNRFGALDFRANREAATSPALSQYRIVHFATHGLLNTTHPGLSGLIFSLVDRQGNDQNGFLPTHEIFDLNLPADLVVLSGCRTGLGKEIKGEGMLGLTRGFMYAGAARVAVSLWDVNDRSTAELMASFYRGMLGRKRLSPASALREAQVAMWKSADGRAPYYWAAFVLQGEYR
jgi:CHAT domain-containing protein/Tfp pilus assembly protein PilF